MAVRELVPGILSVGVVDWDRRLFDGLIPLPQGTSYHSYLVRGSEKTALIDTVDPTSEFEFVCNLVRSGVDTIDYIIVNHAEQDHAGLLPLVMELFPSARVLATEKCCDLLAALLEIDRTRCDPVADGQTISLGDRTLEFIHAPFVHWPETMLTFERESGVLFPCDLFGAHYATSEVFADGVEGLEPAAKRYFGEIMMPFRTTIAGHLTRLESFPVRVIAPSHGPAYRDPGTITRLYREWTSDSARNLVIIPYISMHGSVGKMVDHLTSALMEKGIAVRPFNLAITDLGELAIALVDAATIVVGTPTVLFGPHPTVVSAVYIASILRPKARFLTVIGSYGWGGKAVEQIKEMTAKLHAELLEPVMVCGAPTDETMRALDRLAETIAMKHNDILMHPSQESGS